MTATGPARPPESARSPAPWRHLDLGRCEPFRAQAFAESVAESVAAGEVPNTLLTVQPAAPYISLGFHQSFVVELDERFLARRRVPVIRRVEGGGTTWLDSDQWFYQLVYRDEEGGRGGADDLARFLTAPVRAARELGLPAELRPPSDLVVGARKVSGNAGGDWADAHLIVGGMLGRADHRAMSDLLRLPHPAVRRIVRSEVERWVSSWEVEAGATPTYGEWRDRLVDAFRTLALLDARPGHPSPAEEARFRAETVPRHEDPAWREIPPVPRRPDAPERRLRIAGPHGVVVWSDPATGVLEVAVVDGSVLREAYRIERGPGGEPPEPLAVGSPAFLSVGERLSSSAPFD